MFLFVPIRVDLLGHLIREDRVEVLKMYKAEISSSGLAALFDAAKQSRIIRRLDLDLIDFDEEALDALVTLMRQSTSITQYRLQSTELRPNCVAAICDALANNVVFQELFLVGNDLGLESARIIGRFLNANKNQAFQCLNLTLNPFDDKGVIALIKGLRSNKTLRKLYLGRCHISTDGVNALSSLLAHGSPLELLSLLDDRIQEAGLMALAKALAHNQKLQRLDLFGNPGGKKKQVEDAFIDTLQSNVTLVAIKGLIKSSEIENLLLRNKEQIPAVVRCAALLLIGIRQLTNFEGMGDFGVFPKDIVRLIAQRVYATRRDPVWIQALKD